ncbi:RluA family pseudouridine synthase [Dolosicoccus paucivorans]
MHINILYEDNHLIVVEKPVNIAVQGDQSGDKCVLDYLKDFIKQRDNKPGNVFLALVHRLDRPVGGVLVCAKTSKAASRLANTLRLRQMERSYLTIVHRLDRPIDEKWTDYLWKDRQKNLVYSVSKNKKGSQKATAYYKTLETDPHHQLSLMKVKLNTGRSHQIRVQLSSRKCPIWADHRYGRMTKEEAGEQIALWAYSVSFKHPTRDEVIYVTCPPPKNKVPWRYFNIEDKENRTS